MVEYIDEIHCYLVDGVMTPSVTQLLKKKFGGMYSNIPPQILANKAQFGTNVHKYIESIETSAEPPQISLEEGLCVNEYLKLKEKHNINGIESEMIVNFDAKYCGTLDLIADVNYFRCLCDIKTTAKLNKEYLKYQLGLYAFALESMGYPHKFEKHYAIWLPKNGKGKLVEIPKLTKKEFDEFMEQYGGNEDE